MERPVRVLIVDDDVDSAELLGLLLSERGLEVAVARSVESALDLGRAERFDLVMSDLRLPDGDGYALLEQLNREHPIVGIAVSGSEGADVAVRCREAGYGAQFLKPVDVERLVQEVFRLVGDRAKDER